MASIPRRSECRHPPPQWLLRYAARRRHLGPECDATTTRSPDTARRRFVAHRSAAEPFSRQYGDAAGKERQRLLLIWIKQPLLLEAFSQLGQPQQQTVAAFSTFHSIHDQTRTSGWGVEVPCPRDDHHITRLGDESDAAAVERHALASTIAFFPGAGIREGEVPVPTGVGPPPVGHLPPDRDGATAFQVSLDIRTGVFDFKGSGRRIVHDEDATLGSITGSLPAPAPNAALSSLPGIGSVRAERLAALGLRTVEDLMRHRPLRWERQVDLATIDKAKAAAADPKAVLVLHGEIERPERFARDVPD